MSKSKDKHSRKYEQGDEIKRLAQNRYAKYQYEIFEILETGIELLGTEVKSIRLGNINLRDGFCLIRKRELHLHNVNIARINNAGNFFNHDPLRVRKLLAHRQEIDKLETKVNKKGLSLIPLSIHLKGSWIKVKIGLCKGKKLHDKRESEKRKQEKKEVKSALSRF